jgi:hypothetical protein
VKKQRVEIPLTPAQAEKLRASGIVRGLRAIQKRIGEAIEPGGGDLNAEEVADTAAIEAVASTVTRPRHPHREAILKNYRRRKKRGEPNAAKATAKWVAGKVKAGRMKKPVHPDTIRAWDREVQTTKSG